MARLSFLFYVLGRYAARQSTTCPHCASPDTVRIGRKKLLLELRRCRTCGLMFRYPKDDAAKNRAYYQDDYRDPNVTSLPDEAALKASMAQGFGGGNLDFTRHIAHIRTAGGAGKLLDLGCSWGYGVWQFRRAGFDALGFEISKPRARFGRERLGVEIIDSLDRLAALPDAAFDVVHASHVLEHLPDIAMTLRFVRRVLRPGGLFAIYVPNCGGTTAQRLGLAWGGSISEEHVLALDARFFATNLPTYGFTTIAFGSAPYDHQVASLAAAEAANSLAGQELLVLAQ